ncbi:MAG: glycerophosphoryl diester phosphodiesterase [Neolewinella sp.]|jgi:glycerophosphoryl diester phosphodiesterase
MNRISILLVLLLCSCTSTPLGINTNSVGPALGNDTTATQNDVPLKNLTSEIDWQGHRGCRGLLPENTVPAFLRALSYPEVKTLELDVVISKDNRVIVSHEPWMNPEICLSPSGERLSNKEEDRIKIIDLTAEEITTYDCGQLEHSRFPDQAKRPAHKPTLAAVFAAVDRYCVQNKRPSPRYNIELKFEAQHEGEYHPDRPTFVDLVLEDVDAWGHPEMVTLQCFDPPTLKVIHDKRPEIHIAYLDEFPGDLKQKMDAIGFVPPAYSPYHIHVTADIMAQAKALNMAVVPWTVNTVEDMHKMLDLGVDGIITDYPNRIAEALVKNK